MNIIRTGLMIFMVCVTPLMAQTQTNKESPEPKENKKPLMKFLGAFDAGLPNVSIIKLLDPTDEVLCYVLMPDHTTRRLVEKDKWVYEANSVGSISCLKVRIPVIPLSSGGSM